MIRKKEEDLQDMVNDLQNLNVKIIDIEKKKRKNCDEIRLLEDEKNDIKEIHST